MVCQKCKVCEKEDNPYYLCLYVDRDCFDGCDFCLDNDGEIEINANCKYEGGIYEL